jgi:hypothetical protein
LDTSSFFHDDAYECTVRLFDPTMTNLLPPFDFLGIPDPACTADSCRSPLFNVYGGGVNLSNLKNSCNNKQKMILHVDIHDKINKLLFGKHDANFHKI